MKTIAVLVLMLGTSVAAFAQVRAPEIDSSTAASAIALVSGGLLVLRGRRKK